MLEDRYFKVMDEGVECLDNEPLILVIINNKAVIDNMATNKNAMEVYKKIISKYKTMKVVLSLVRWIMHQWLIRHQK